MKLLSLFVSSTIILILTASCDTNPLDELDALQRAKPADPALPAFVLDIPALVEFNEGEEKEFSFRARVPSPGDPIVTISNLPDGATFDASNHTIVWTPSFTAANHPDDMSMTTRGYPIEVSLESTSDSMTIIKKQTVLWVKDISRDFYIETFGDKNYVKEGETLEQIVKVSSPDFPNGPFGLSLSNAPAGVRVKKTHDPSTFLLEYTPVFESVTVDDPFYYYYGHYKKFETISLVASTPRGSTRSEITWYIFDKRQQPQTFAPTSVSQGKQANFSLLVRDPNWETTPSVELATDVPFGTVEIEVKPTGESQSDKAVGIANIRWHSIPEDKLGTTEPIELSVCVNESGSTTSKSLCKKTKIEVTFNKE